MLPFYPSEDLIRGANETGSGEKLAHLIIKHHQTTAEHSACLLYLTGDKNTNTIPTLLSEAGISLVDQQVYETHPSSTLDKDIEEIPDDTQDRE